MDHGPWSWMSCLLLLWNAPPPSWESIFLLHSRTKPSINFFDFFIIHLILEKNYCDVATSCVSLYKLIIRRWKWKIPWLPVENYVTCSYNYVLRAEKGKLEVHCHFQLQFQICYHVFFQPQRHSSGGWNRDGNLQPSVENVIHLASCDDGTATNWGRAQRHACGFSQRN